MSISLTEPYSISQFSQANHKSFANQGLVDKISFKSINDFFLFPFYDELLQTIKLNSFFPFFLVIVLLVQAFKTFSSFSENGVSDFFTNFNFSETYQTIALPFFYFIFDIFYFSYVILQYRTKRMFNYWQLYLSALILNFFNVIIFMPTCGVCGYSVIRLNQVISTHYLAPQTNFTEYNYPQLFLNKNSFFDDDISKYKYNMFNNLFQNKKYNFKKVKDNPNNDNKDNEIYSFNATNNKYYTIRNVSKKNEIFNLKNIDLQKNTNKYYSNSNKTIESTIHKKYYNHLRTLEDIEIDIPSLIPEEENENNGKNEKFLFNSEVTKYSFSLIYTLIEAIIHGIQITYNFHFVSESPYLDRTIFGMWDCKVFVWYVLLMGVNQFSSYVLIIFPIWCTIVYHIFIIIIDIYILYYTFFQPFIKISMNSFFQSLLTYNLLSNIIIILYHIKSLTIYFYIISFLFLALIPFFIIYYFINKKIINTVNKKLSPKILFDEQGFEDDQLDLNFSDETTLKNSSSIFRIKNENQQIYQMTDNEKRDMFDKYVFQSIEHALLYLRVGISCSSPYFTDFSFIRYMKETYGQMPIQIFILRLTAFFPSEHQFLNYCISLLSKREDFMNAYDQFVMYQLHRINIVRQSSVSKELQGELTLLDNMCDETISSIRGFWAEIFQAKLDFEISSLRFIRKMTLSTKSCYIDALEKFPNSTHILNSYCRFLCEACGDYIECFRIGQKIRLIEQGKHVTADYCFHAFVNVFPQYLKKKILNEKGNFIHESSGSTTPQLSAAVSTGQISASFDNISGLHSMNTSVNSDSNKNYNYAISNKNRNKVDLENLIEQDNFEVLISTLFSSAKSRLTIQQIVDRSRNYPLLSALAVSVCQTVCFLIIILLELSFLNAYQNPIQFLESTARTSKIIFSFQYCSLVAGIQYLAETYETNISAKMIEYLNIREENLPRFPCTFILPMVSLTQITKNIVDLIDQEMKFIFNNPTEHLNAIRIYTGLDPNYYANFSSYNMKSHEDKKDDIDDIDAEVAEWENGIDIYKLRNNTGTFYKVTLRTGLEYFKAVVDRLAYEHTFELFKNYNSSANTKSSLKTNSVLLDDPNQPNLSKFTNVYFELLINGLAISEPFTHLFKVISKSGVELIKSNERFLINLSLAIIVVCLLVFVLARIYCYYKIRQLLSMQSKAIKKVKNEDIIESMKPIYLKSQRIIKIHSASNHSIYETSPIPIIFAIVSFSSIFILLGIFSISVFQFKSAFNFIENAQRWENDSASRFLYLAMMMNCLISEHLGAHNLHSLNHTHINSADLLDLSQKLDMSIIGKGKSLKDFYFIINENATTNHVKSQSNNNSQSKSMNFNARKQKDKLSQIFNKKLLLEEAEMSSSTSNIKCNDIDNSNSLTQMNLATYLDCISIESKVNLGIQFYRHLEKTLKDDNLVGSQDFITSLFILDKYLYQDIPNFQDTISATAKTEMGNQKRSSTIIAAIGICVSILLFILEILVLQQINFGFEAFKQLMMVLPPSAFTNNSFIIDFLIGSSRISKGKKSKYNARNGNSDDKYITDEEILLNTVGESVINTDENLIIQSVNPAIQKMTGFLPDQLLGQSILFLIPPKSKFADDQSIDKFPFYQRLGEIKGSNGDRVHELNAKVITDKGQEILVHATIIGMFDKNKKSLNLKASNLYKFDQFNEAKKSFVDKNDPNANKDDEDEDESTTTTTNSTAGLNSNKRNINNDILLNNEDDDDESEHFIGVTVILKDISDERKLKKDLKETKKKNETLLSLLIPQPVLEEIRASRKPTYYTSNTATLIKLELNGFDEYTSTMVPKTIMTNLQTIYSKIDQLTQKSDQIKKFNSLFNKEEKDAQINQGFNTTSAFFGGQYQQSANSLLRFNFNFNLNSTDEQDEDLQFHGIPNSSCTNPKTARPQADDDEEENIENDKNCDFGCVYNIRNDNDQFISVSGLFDSQDELRKQAESSLRYALKVNKIIENIGIEDQVNMFVHTRIAVCMGGPVFGFVEDPENPQIQIFTNLMKEADAILNECETDVVYINENVYKNIDKDKFEIEEKIIKGYQSTDEDPNVIDEGEKIYAVYRCLKKPKQDDNGLFAISSDSEN